MWLRYDLDAGSNDGSPWTSTTSCVLERYPGGTVLSIGVGERRATAVHVSTLTGPNRVVIDVDR